MILQRVARVLALLVALALLTQTSPAQLSMTGVGGGFGGAAAGCAEATAFLARKSGTTNNAQLTTLICGLVTDGVWAKLDAFYVFAQDTQANALLNLVSSSFNGTLTGSPTFTASQGFSAANSTNFVNTNLNSSTAGGLASTNAYHFSAWDNASTVGDGKSIIGVLGSNIEALFARFSDGNTYYRFTGGDVTAASANANGFFLGNRSGASAVQGYKNGTSVTSGSPTAAALFSANWNIPGDGGAAFSADPIMGGSIGGSLSSTDVSNFYARFHTYLQVVAGIP